jgi:DNA-3-methyladenine glycosylase II
MPGPKRMDPAGLRRAARSLARRDPALGAWIEHLGPLPAAQNLRRPASSFSALARALLAQQLSNKAAQTIIARTFAHAARAHCPRPEEILALDEATLRVAGVSGQKAGYLRELARAFHEGPLSTARFSAWSDERVIAELTAIKGVGRWTAEMFLIFALHRPDVFAPGDLALRRGIERIEGRPDMSPKECEAIAERWAPHRSVASLYLWRIAHAESEPGR